MGVYINMEMPTKCSECLLAKLSPTGESLICNYMLSRVPWDEGPFDCPLVPIPPHGRLGDLDDFAKRMKSLVEKAENDGFDLGAAWYSAFVRHIELTPTIIPASEEGET